MGIQSVIAEILFVRYVNSINTEKKKIFQGKIICRNASGNYVHAKCESKAEIDGTRECLKCYLPTNRRNLEKHGIFIRRKSWTCACHLLSQKEEAYYQ